MSAKKHPLKGDDLTAAKNLMRMIKGCGYTNKEISESTENSWSEATIKLYTRNTDGARSQLKGQHLALLNSMIKENISIDDMKQGLFLLSELKKDNLTLQSLLEVIRYLEGRKAMLPYLVEVVTRLSDNDTPFQRFAQLDQYKKSLDAQGLDIDFVEGLNNLVSKYGNKASVVKSLLLYDDLSKIKSEISKSRDEREGIAKDLESIKKELASLKVEKENLSTQIGLAQDIDSFGFSNMMLKDLRDFSRKYDCDTARIIKAIDQFSDVAHLKSEITSLGAQKLQLEGTIDKMEHKLGRLTGLSKISEAFLTKFNFNLYDLNLIYELATRQGNPSNFFRALARFSNLQRIEQKMGELQNEKISLELNIVELEKTKLELEQTTASLGQTAKSVMENISSGVGNIFQEVADKVASELDRSLAQLRNSYDEYSLLRAKMRSSKEQLRVCSVIRAVMYNDVETIQTIPPGYLSIFIQGALNLCYGKYLNPSTDMPPSIVAKYQIYPTVDFELADLLELAKNTIQAVKA